MIVSPDKPRRHSPVHWILCKGATLAACFALIVGVEAAAQSEDAAPPAQLTPAATVAPDAPLPAPAENQILSAPTALAPPRLLKPAVRSKPVATPDATMSEPSTEGGRTEPGVQVDTLASVDPETVGTLGPDNGGLGMNLWKGTDRAYVETMLAHLPVKAPSPVMRDLMRRLLMTAAMPPKRVSKLTGAVPDAANPSAAGESLISKRVRLLAGMGDVGGVSDILAAIPGNVTDSNLLLVQADARFLANDNARACGIAAQQILTNDRPYWQRAMIFCQILAGDPSKAELGLTMMNELGVEAPEFQALADRLLGGASGELQSLAGADGLLLAMARAAKTPLPADVGKSDRPGVLRAIAVNPNVAIDQRLDAAERAEAAGALDTAALRQLYSSIEFEAGDLSRPLSRAQEIGGPVSRALLYHSALSQSIPTAQAEIISRALEIAVAEGRYGAAARVFQPVVAKIPPSAALLWFAPAAVRLMLSNNDPDGAKSWFQLLQASALFHKESAAHLVRLTPLVRLVGTMGLEREPRDLAAWWGAVGDDPGASMKAALFYGLLDGLGEEVPLAAWRQLQAVRGSSEVAMAVPSMASAHPALMFRLSAMTEHLQAESARRMEMQASHMNAPDAAVPDGDEIKEAAYGQSDASPGPPSDLPEARELMDQRGEVILMMLAALGDKGPAGAGAAVLRQVVTSMRTIGLEKEAKALALEAALAAGL